MVVPAEGEVGGIVFNVDEYDVEWGSARSRSVDNVNSIMTGASLRDYGTGAFCIADFILGYTPQQVCAVLAPGAQTHDWITPFFAGPKSEVGIAFTSGGCDPAACTATLRITGIRLIYYDPNFGD
jgi:hypothetical protein